MRISVLNLSVISSLALTGALSSIANAGTLYATRNGATLYEVSTTDAALTIAALLNDDSEDGEAIAFHPPSGNLYRWSGNEPWFVSTLDPSNSFAETALSSDPGGEIASATWDSANNNFFATNIDSEWRTMASDGTAGAATSFANSEFIRGVAFVGSTLYALEHAGSFDAGVVDLLTIDPATGDILDNVDLNIPGYTDDGAFGLAYDPDTGTLYAALGIYGDQSDRFLAEIDPLTGDGTAIGNFSTNGINSLAVIPNPVPEPTTLALLAAGTMLALRRKK